ncbi:2,3-diaminopropionate biosynthesis protein SbnB [Actinoplanes sp. CA-054009]
MATTEKSPFTFVSATAVQEALNANPDRVIDLVRRAYILHGRGATVNPPSSFLRFPGSSRDRIIALPAAVNGEIQAVGLKWISSFPGNLALGMPRASAVIVLNDQKTGFPVACLESSLISAHRTAASAVLAADHLAGSRRGSRIGFVGAGFINGHVQRYLLSQRWPQSVISVHDQDLARAERFADRLRRAGLGPVSVRASAEEVVRESELIVLATTSAAPYLLEPSMFEHHPLVLHISLRDLGPRVILDSINIVDDRDHCQRENTSTHLAAQQTGDDSFLHGTIPELLAGTFRPRPGATTVVSPFGLGMLDVVLADFVLAEARASGRVTTCDGFFDGADEQAQWPSIAD